MRVVLVLFLNLTAMAQIKLPAPTGPYPIGRQMLLWRDSTRLEDVGPQSGKPREVATYIFYPAVASGDHTVYYPGLAGLETAPETRPLRLQFGAAWNAVTTGTIQTNTYAAPPMPSGSARFPVLIFSPGGVAPVLGYQLQLEELASRGYVIFALEHGTDSALIIRPDGTLLPYFSRHAPGNGLPTTANLETEREQVIRRTADVIFALDQINAVGGRADSIFHHRLDLARIGVFGHSEGGKTALRACQLDSRIRACLNQDGEMFNQPLNPPESVLLEPHVWVGQEAMLLKGSHVGTGSIIGAKALVNGPIPPVSAAAGLPAKVIKRGVSWDRAARPLGNELPESLVALASALPA